MTATTANLAAEERMTPDDYAVTALAGYFADCGPLSFERFLSGYYAESIRLIQEAHLTDCTAGDGEHCATCDSIRVGLVGLLAEQRAVTSTPEGVTGHDRH
ncbi:hypothetical protein EV384_0361 [Micromonospora kangleipakensis]|uniref:Uncharacterized protein n=1 Tax=Micromonospora kangleipakensis TaxID=1077942 RepID=A0A4Q8B3E4_9ACTN|nr:hypothetical protein [Micromonospora kangleipakensis]RZU72022.1 hypothetical protein EV384_0361 [Micromonospora kangleipakensis]